MSPKLTRTLLIPALLTVTLSSLHAQNATSFSPLNAALHPANLAGERVSPPALAMARSDDPANLMGERVSAPSLADTLAINHGAPALAQLLLKLRTRASLMMIVAHPDDEDGGFLTFESRGAGARVAMLTLTRGEGGQNLMSADFNDALGLIRTQELLAADRYMGVDQFFGTEVDFGFSKTKEETFQQWTHDRVLYDAVRSVRLYRPLVLASVFVGGPTDGHGHHQVAGEITQEVFLAAADPKVFPEMGLPPWAPLKVYARIPFSRVSPQGMFDYATGKTIPTRFENYVTGKITNVEPTPTVLIHEGDPATLSFGGPGLPHQSASNANTLTTLAFGPIPTPGMDGLTYVQFARKGLALQKTQIGPNVRLAPVGRSDTGYTLMASRLNCVVTPTGCPVQSTPSTRTEQSIYDGIDTSLPALAPANSPPILRQTLADIDHNLAEAERLFDPAHLELTVPALRASLRLLDQVLLPHIDSANLRPEDKFNLLHELRIKRVQLNNALLLALQIDASADVQANAAGAAALVPGSPFTVQSTLSNPAQTSVTVSEYKIRLTEDHAPARPGAPDSIASADLIGSAPVYSTPLILHSHISANSPPTRPYFHRPSIEQPFYNMDDPALRNAPQTPAPLNLLVTLEYQGVTLDLIRTVAAAQDAPDTLPAPAVIVPGLSIVLAPDAGIITQAGKPLLTTAIVTSQTATPKATATVTGPAGWEGTLDTRMESIQSGQRQTFPLSVTPTHYFAGRVYLLDGIASDASYTYREGFRPVGYPGLTYTNFYTPAIYRATAVDVTTTPSLRIAYLPGTGDSVADFLPSLGVTPTLLAPKDLTSDTLKQFDEIILGVRAYSAHPDLDSAALQSFAQQGGVVVLQYMSGGFPASASPYPLTIPGDSAHNVVVEAQPVTLLQPSAPLLTWPNKLTSADFDGWTEERGHGFASTWDPHFQALLETRDPDQDPQRGGLLVAPVGKGAYIYVSLALYRQLPEGVPGAYRLFANLLSYPKNPHR